MVPVQSTKTIVTPIVPMDAPSCAKTNQVFDEVSSALYIVSSAHKEVKAQMQSLATRMEELRRTQAGNVEAIAQVQQTLQRTLSASSSLEMHVGQAEAQQSQARAVADKV